MKFLVLGISVTVEEGEGTDTMGRESFFAEGTSLDFFKGGESKHADT
jgi:hypothetical protein